MPETPPNGFAAEPALLGSLHLAAIIESSDDAIIGKDLRGIIQSWNRGAERMFGYTVAEAVGKSVSILAVPGRLDEIPDILQRIARGERIDHYQTQRQTKDGRVLVISLTVSPIHDATGKVIGASKIARDVTELVDYQNALRQSESSFRQLADSMPHMVWTATPDGNVDYYNRHWHDYTGMSLDQSRNWGWQPVLHPSHLQSTIDLWTHSFTSGEPFKVECLLKRASDGAYRWHLSQAQPVRDTQGKIVRWFGACSDVHDYKQAASENQTLNEHLETRVRERTAELDLANQQLSHANAELHVSALRLEQTNRELQDFASVTSHDLQEPLRKVQAFGDRLNIECRRQIHERGRGYLDRMLNSTKRMQSLIEDLLRFAHVTSQARPFFPVDLAQVAREVVSDLEVRILETKALVQLGALPTIDADAVQMRQLLQNLIGNALKFHLPGVPPVVRVYAESFDSPAAEPMIRLIVHDKGIGFDEKYLDRIFTVFQRLHDEAQYPGTGIGLAICRKIVQRHGGGITAKSSPGHGASFLVELPFRPASGIGLTLPPSAVDTPIGTPGDRNSSAPPGTEKIS